MKADTPELRVILLGEGGVGKSSLAIRYISNMWVEEYDPTIEDWYRKIITIEEKPYLLDILDTAGPESFDAMYDAGIRRSQGFLLVFAIDNAQTVEKAFTYMDRIELVHDKPLNEMPVVLVATKGDLAPQVSCPEVVARARGRSPLMPFVETSAKIDKNVTEVFETLARLMIDMNVPLTSGKRKHRKDNRCVLS
ncbi:Ras-related protein M-Ras [Balamuthia mandrillaris]